MPPPVTPAESPFMRLIAALLALTLAAIAAGAELVVVAGGDGTVREVAHGLARTGVELGIVPVGTANLLAHNLGLPRTVPAAVQVAVAGRPRPVDLGLARVDDSGDLPFVVLAGMGHDAATVAAADEHAEVVREAWAQVGVVPGASGDCGGCDMVQP